MIAGIELFEPGTYGSASDPPVFTVGYCESVAGLGQMSAAGSSVWA